MKILVLFSGGKDSSASLILACKEYGIKNTIAVFCDTGWEHKLTYDYIEYLSKELGCELIKLKSKKYENLVDLSLKKKRFPSAKARFCTWELKIKPFIDFILDEIKEDILIIQGIRKEESLNRSKMKSRCTYFNTYFQDKKSSHRKKEFIEFNKKYTNDLLRPIFDWSTKEVFNYIKENNCKVNELYNKGFTRVGCMPCIMCKLNEIKLLEKEYREKLINAEKLVNHSFFPPSKIPERFCKGISKGIKYPHIQDVFNYVDDDVNQLSLFSESFICNSGFC